MPPSRLVELFISVLNCSVCPSDCVLRDAVDNIPQPGWIGRRFDRGVLFIGQNPGVRRPGSTQLAADVRYIGALREVKDEASLSNLLEAMYSSMQAFVMYKHYIPTEFFEQIAIINAVRCRTVGNLAPAPLAVKNCGRHLNSWLDYLRPRAIVFNGVWALQNVGSMIADRGLPYETINRQRSLSTEDRRHQQERVRRLVMGVARC